MCIISLLYFEDGGFHMTSGFNSTFADRLSTFISQKNVLGYPYYESVRILSRFDKFCVKHYPDATELTKEICLSWAVRKSSESNNSFRNRIFPIREFAKYLNSIGENAYLIPVDLVKKGYPSPPHIYSADELDAIWTVLESIPFKKNFPVRHLVLPTLFKLLYCCGLRPPEARCLLRKNVDLEKGRIDIIEGKAHKSRIVMLADDTAEMLRAYDNAVNTVIPDRTMFFPSSTDTLYTKVWLDKSFRIILKKAGITGYGKRAPRPYDFRHTFATHRIYQWMKEGKDVEAMLPYLSAYMGHAQLSDTYYYIHLVPDAFKSMSGFDDSKLNVLIPEVNGDD